MLKCSRLRWVCAPQYRLAGTSTSPRLSNSRRAPEASSPIGMSRISGAWVSGPAMVGRSLVVGRLPHRVLDRLHQVLGLDGGHAIRRGRGLLTHRAVLSGGP